MCQAGRVSFMESVLVRAKEVYDKITPAEQKVADFILGHTDEIADMTASELSEKSGASSAAVFRFCKEIGCTGYRDFLLQLSAEMAIVRDENDDRVHTDVNVGDSIENIKKNVGRKHIQAIQDSTTLISDGDLERAAKAILDTRRIDIYASGASQITAQDAQMKFMRINKYCTAYVDPHAQLMSAANLEEGDVAMGIAWTGTSTDIIHSVRTAKEHGAFIITVTRFGANPLASLADVAFRLSSPETNMGAGAMSSRIVEMTLVDILYSVIVSFDYNNVRGYLDKTHSVINDGQKKKER